jgi:hypothetical protein
MRTIGCAALLAFVFLCAPSVAAAAPHAVTVQGLQDRVRTALADISQGGTQPSQFVPPEENTLQTTLTERFDDSIEAHIASCDAKPGMALAGSLAPHFADNVLAAWHRLDKLAGGHRVGVSVGLGKEFLGYENGIAVEDKWVNFHVNVRLFGPHRSCTR